VAREASPAKIQGNEAGGAGIVDEVEEQAAEPLPDSPEKRES